MGNPSRDPDAMLQTFITNGTGNDGLISDPKVDALFEKQKVELDEQKRIELVREAQRKIWDLSRERESSEQFVWLNRRYGETETQLSRSAIIPSIRADSSQNEVI